MKIQKTMSRKKQANKQHPKLGERAGVSPEPSQQGSWWKVRLRLSMVFDKKNRFSSMWAIWWTLAYFQWRFMTFKELWKAQLEHERNQVQTSRGRHFCTTCRKHPPTYRSGAHDEPSYLVPINDNLPRKTKYLECSGIIEVLSGDFAWKFPIRLVIVVNATCFLQLHGSELIFFLDCFGGSDQKKKARVTSNKTVTWHDLRYKYRLGCWSSPNLNFFDL